MEQELYPGRAASASDANDASMSISISIVSVSYFIRIVVIA
jgi:hypothetical protein